MSRSLLPVSLILLSLSVPLTAQPASHADLVIEATPPSVLPVAKVAYLWAGLRNQGPDAAENVVITTAAGRFLSTVECLPDASGKRCTIAFLPAGDNVTLGIDLERELRPGRLHWAFEVTSDTPDPNPANNRIAGETEVTRAPAMSFYLSGNTADPGETVEYTATIANESNIVAEDVSFTLPLPDGWSFERTLTEELRCEQTGREVRCTIDEIEPLATVRSRFVLRAPNDTAGRVYQSAPVKLTTRHGVTDEYQRATGYFATSIYRQITVTTTADLGEGSLRYAIALVNADCTGHPNPECKIAFDIPGGGTHRTIRPESPLPAISGIVFIDGATQTRRHGDTNPDGPEIEINGSLLATGNGFEITGRAFSISDAVVNGFPGNGLVFDKGLYGAVLRSYIGTDVTGRTPVPNGGRGITADLGTEYGAGLTLRDNVIGGNGRAGVFIGSLFQASIIGNRIGASAGENPQPLGNGASGIYVGPAIYTVVVQKNLIAFNAEAGVGITKGSGYVAVRGNSIHSNGTLGIDYNLDMVSPDATPFPVITFARYDESTGRTRIEGRIATSQYLGASEAELFANDAPGNEGHGEGELFLGRVGVAGSNFTLDYPGDLRGRYITATATIPNSYYPELPWLYTSEFSAALRVEGEAAAPIDRAAAVPRGADFWVRSGFPYGIEAGVPQQGSFSVQNLGPEQTDEAVVEITSTNARLSNGYAASKCAEIEGGLRCPLGTASYVYFTIDAAIGVEKVDLKARVFSPLPDPDPLNNEASREIEVTGIPNLEVRIDSPGPTDPGDVAIYTVRLFHRSAVDAHDLEVRIPVAHGWTLASSPASRWSCAQEGGEIVCRAARMQGRSSDAFAIGVRAPQSEQHPLPRIDTSARLTARERQSPFYTNVAWELFHHLRVTSTADEGIGSLRDAIARANRECAAMYRCKIVFAIDAAAAKSGVFTIQPRRPLGEISGYNVIIDARTQTAHSGDTNPLGPEVELNGALVSGGNGFDVVSHGQVMIRGFAINGFPENGVWLRMLRDSWNPGERQWIADNYIGTDPTGRIAVPNGGRGIVIQGDPEALANAEIAANVISGNARAGIFIEGGQLIRIAGNRIGLSAGDDRAPLPNGASGIYVGRTSFVTIEGNEIAHNAHAGIAVDRGAKWSGIRGNATYDNGGLGVDHALDSVTFNDDAGRAADLPRFPVILSATWDASAKVTRIVGRAEGSQSNHQAVVELFANAAPDSSGYGEAQRSIGSVIIPASTSEQTFTFETAEDLRGTFVTSTLTRLGDGPVMQWTSEIGQAVPVQ